MSKTVKIVLLIAVIFCLCGGIFVGIGLATGRRSELNNIGNSQYHKYELDKTKLDDFSNLNISLDYLDLEILPSEDEHCYLSYCFYDTSKKNPLSYEIKDNTLTIVEKYVNHRFIQVDFTVLGRFFINGWDTMDDMNEAVTLYIPKDYMIKKSSITLDAGDLSLNHQEMENGSIHLSYGDADINNVTLKKGKITLDDGELDLNQFSGDSLEIKSSYGDINANNLTVNTLSCSIDDGDLNLEHFVTKKASAFSLSYGDAEIGMDKEQLKKTSLNLSTEYGEISILKKVDGMYSAYNNDDEINRFEYTGTDPDCSLTVKSDDGEITIK